MATWFDESRLHDEAALAAADARLRELAEAGARVRREATEAAPGIAAAVLTARDVARPRAIVAAGPDRSEERRVGQRSRTSWSVSHCRPQIRAKHPSGAVA